MDDKNNILPMLQKAEKDFGWSKIGVEITLSDVAKKIGSGTYAKEMIQMILLYRIIALNQSISAQENQEEPDKVILQEFRERKNFYEKVALIFEELY